MEKVKKKWYKRWWAITLLVSLGIGMLMGLIEQMTGKQLVPESKPETTQPKPDYILEMTTKQIFDEFRGLTGIQIDEKLKEFKGKRIKTSIYVSTMNKASLSSQYVAMEMYKYPYNLMPAVKAFFPAEEKNNLLKASIGDTIIFSGEFVTYNKGSLTSYIEFTKSKLIEVKKAPEE